MELSVSYFAAAADFAGTRSEVISIPDSCSVATLRNLLEEGKPEQFGKLIRVCALMLNGQQLHDGDEVSGGSLDVLPPFAGG
ncbi:MULTISPECIES: MoaD/ThiS family protein [Propionimicrobium]|uniref:MoaD/ThiS family protein n=1 Tax=Propionimicrobium TaxID=203133 RepID=UPI0003D796F1|nr:MULTISPECIES: MoaD/ThiS family protein [Propionimicrobium]ETJ97911.1 ThiS family protein [Propionimicrobium sp. BV2F7]